MYLSQGSIIRKNYEILRESEKNIQNFLAFLAHEIRTPLTSIMGATIFISQKKIKQRDEYVKSITGSSHFFLKFSIKI